MAKAETKQETCYEVAQTFRDKTTKKLYEPGDDVSTFSKERLSDLESLGLLKKAGEAA